MNVDKYDLFIFDLDDTLIKTEIYHYKAWLQVLQEKIDNFYIDYIYYTSKFHSITINSITNYLNELYLENHEEIIINKNKLYLEIIKNSNMKLVDGIEIFLEKIIKANKHFVIVSNSLKCHIDYFSELFPILKKSSKNYYRELYVNKKPHPECYLNVINDFPNMTMIGFEDSITGIHAMSQVNIDMVFINTDEYFYYKFIIENYKLKLIINDYNNL